jgi:hypothetical protein
LTVVLQDSVATAAMNHLHDRFFARDVVSPVSPVSTAPTAPAEVRHGLAS